MENNEIMNTEMVVEAAEEIVTNDSNKVLKTLGAVGAVAALGYVTYKFVIKPIVKKVKAKKEIEGTIIEADFAPEASDEDSNESQD